MGAPPASALAAAYLEYVSLGLRRAALYLGLFEQPGKKSVSRQAAEILHPLSFALH